MASDPDPVRESTHLVVPLADLVDVLAEAMFDDAHEHCDEDGCTGGGRPYYDAVARDVLLPVLRDHAAAAGYRLAGPDEVVVSAERLRAADDVAAVFGWCPAGEDSEREKAAVMLWRRWSALAGSSPKDHPHLTDEYLAGLAREWDAVRERARTGLARIVSVERSTSPAEPTEVDRA